jgi:hypothetical protein
MSIGWTCGQPPRFLRSLKRWRAGSIPGARGYLRGNKIYQIGDWLPLNFGRRSRHRGLT